MSVDQRSFLHQRPVLQHTNIGKEVSLMEQPWHKRPAPAIGLAFAASAAAHAANMNAAKALGKSTVVVAVAMMLLVLGIFYLATH